MANIPVMTHSFAKKKLLKIFEDYQQLVKHKKRETETEKSKREVFIKDLEKLFDIAAVDAEEKILKDRLLEPGARCEDIDFLKDQRGSRLGWISVGKVDISYSVSLENKCKRIVSAEKLVTNEKKREEEQSTTVEDIPDNFEETSGDSDYVTKTKQKKSTVTLEVPRNLFADPEVIAMLDRTKCTDRVTTGVVASVLKAHVTRSVIK